MTENDERPAPSPGGEPVPPVVRHLLGGFYRDRGATLEVVAGAERVARWDEPRNEIERLTGGAAWVDRAHHGRIELVGPDRLRLLNGLTTCAVESLSAGEGTYGFVTSAQGRVLADALILEHADRTWLELPPATGRTIGDHVRKYIIADQVEVLPLEDMLPISVVGPEAESRLGIDLGPDTGSGAEIAHAKVEVTGIEVHAVRHRVAGLPACTLWVSASVAKPLIEGLEEDLGLPAVGNQALDALRVRSLVPAFGFEFGPDHFPQETGAAAAAVSYEKGCYLGQEVVARIHYRGKVNRGLRRLEIGRPEDGRIEPPSSGTALTFEGKEVGVIGTVVRAVDPGAVVQFLAIVHAKAGALGTELELGGGGRATVVAAPEGSVD